MRLSVFDNGFEVPEEIWPDLPPPMAEWLGDRFEWKDGAGFGPVFIRHFGPLSSESNNIPECDVWLFGFRYDFSDALVKPDAYEGGNVIEFGVVVHEEGNQEFFHLRQRYGAEYCAEGGGEDGDFVGDMTRTQYAALPRIDAKPVWKQEDMTWPAVGDTPMVFAGQVLLPESDLTKRFLTFDEMVYLFLGRAEGRTVPKIVTQDPNAQTAGEHYALEELMGRFDVIKDDDDAVVQLAAEGGRYAHEYLLEVENVSDGVLQFLASDGANKSIRSVAKKRLNR